jgi:hypothetical protein
MKEEDLLTKGHKGVFMGDRNNTYLYCDGVYRLCMFVKIH